MIVNENTILVQLEDGLLYYKDGDEIQLASMTDIQKHYKTMQYNLCHLIGCYVTDRPDLFIGMDDFMWKATYGQIPENCERIK